MLFLILYIKKLPRHQLPWTYSTCRLKFSTIYSFGVVAGLLAPYSPTTAAPGSLAAVGISHPPAAPIQTTAPIHLMLLQSAWYSHPPVVGIKGQRSWDLPSQTAEPVHEDAATSGRIRKGRFRGPASSSFRGAAAAGPAKGRRRWPSLGVGNRRMERVGPGSPRWESSVRGREASFWRAGRIARAGHPPWPAISEDGEPGSLAIYAQRDFRDSILAIIQNQIGYLLEFNFSCKNLNIPYRIV